MKIRGGLVILVAIAALLPLRPANADDDFVQPIPLRSMVGSRLVASMVLSPDGQSIAGIGIARGWPVVFLQNTQTLQIEVIAKTQNFFRAPIRVNWVNKDLLAVDYYGGESWAMTLAGKRTAKLGERFIRRMIEKGATTDLVLAFRDVEDAEIDVVNARSGERKKYRVSLAGKPTRWAFDATGALRAVTMLETSLWAEKSKLSNWYRVDEESPWQLLEEFGVTDDAWYPIRVLPERDSLMVVSRRGRDTYAIFRYDAAKREHVEMMAGHPTQDIIGASGLDEAAFERVTTGGIRATTYWFDPRWAARQASVDAALPGRTNVLTGDPDGQMLIHSFGDVDPGRWYVLDAKALKIREMGDAMPGIDPKRMRPMETLEYKARDGLLVNAYLTRPALRGNALPPLIVLVHGGPNVRDWWQWDEEVQILAASGYAVFQPQFRGSEGFGRKFQEAGYLQWGRDMQDDITDGVRKLIADKAVDPGRICIYGASYGGYAALWGVINTPSLYKCGVSFAGVSDPEALISFNLFDDSTSLSREIRRARIGNPATMRERLAEVSPLKNAAKVQVPLLIAHGEEDTRVLISHSKDMVNALRKLGKPVEWMPFPGEGHGLYLTEDRVRYYAALLSFLERHIGEHDEPVPEPAAQAAMASASAASN